MRHRAFSFQIALVLALLQPFGASYCGSNGVPYSLEILSDGLCLLWQIEGVTIHKMLYDLFDLEENWFFIQK